MGAQRCTQHARRFDRRRFPPEHDVVKQGDDADFCFIIRSGRCDVLVELKDSSAGKAPAAAAAPSTASDGRPAQVAAPASPAGHATPAAVRPSGAQASSAVGTPASEGGSPASKVQSGTASPAFGALQKQGSSKMGKLLKAATAWQEAAGVEGPPLRVNFRHIVTLQPGTIAGEVALLHEGSKRMATVRTSENAELLILDKKSFLDLDRATLNIIGENARYNAACTREPSQRTRDDLQILKERTAHLSHLSSLSPEVHMELCRVMRYRKVDARTILVRAGMPATCLSITIAGVVHTYTSTVEPTTARRKWSLVGKDRGGGLAGRQGGSGRVSASQLLKGRPTEVLTTGKAIGEDELLMEDPVHAATVVTVETVELMEISRALPPPPSRAAPPSLGLRARLTTCVIATPSLACVCARARRRRLRPRSESRQYLGERARQRVPHKLLAV